jgi:hypothetical protein
MSTEIEEKIERFENAVWEEFLSKASPKEIHQSVIDSNWDGNGYLLNWIKNNPNIDKASALIAYWMSAPRWQKKFKDREDVIAQDSAYYLADFDFIEEMEEKYLTGFWKNNCIECDPSNDCEGYDWTSDYLDEKTVREIPSLMFEKLQGEKVERPDNFIEGLPEDYYQKISDYIDKNDK